MPVLAATFTTAIVFFPVVFLYGVSRFLFTALAASVVFSLFASYVVAMTVVPLFCARFINGRRHHGAGPIALRLHHGTTGSRALSTWFNHTLRPDADALRHCGQAKPASSGGDGASQFSGLCLFSLALYPLLGVSASSRGPIPASS